MTLTLGFGPGEAAPGDQVARLRPVDLAAYGADDTGATDCSAAFVAAMADVWGSRLAPDPAGTSAAVLRKTLTIGPGTYRVASPKALLGDHSGGARAGGLVIRGAGMNVTQIIFDPEPADAAGPMMLNDDEFLHVTFEDLEFASTAVSTDPVKPVFLDSHGDGGTKDILFNRCRWTGRWSKVVSLRGVATNAQMGWRNCSTRRFTAEEGFLHSQAPGHPAFVNYWFDQCSFSLRGGHLINAEGHLGHIHLINSMFLYEDGTGDGTLIRLMRSDGGGNESQLTATNVYVELHDDGQRLLESHWPAGHIRFTNVTWNSTGPGTFDDPVPSVAVEVHNENKGIPAITFDSCGMKGIHRFHQGSDAGLGPQRTVVYRRCQVLGQASPATMVQYVNIGGTGQAGGRPAVVIDECTFPKYSNDHQRTWSQTMGWERAMGGTPQVRKVKFLSPRGDIVRPSDPVAWRTRVLPTGAIVTAVELHVVSGGTPATDWSFAFQTTDTPAVPIITIPSNGRALANGRIVRIEDLDVRCDTDPQRTIAVVVTGTVPNSVIGALTLEYLA